jgi:hypothetical protein
VSEAKWERRDCVSAEVEQSLVLLDLDTLLYHSLNQTASAIWEMLAEPRSATEIADGLCVRYRVSPDVCRASVDRTLQRFQEAGLAAPKAAA